MTSEKFRRLLRQEAASWQTDGLITASQYDQLAQRYQFQSLDTDSRNRFVVILMGLGGILLGLGIITFVAANWQAWPRSVKLALLLGLLISSNTAGFYLWQGSSSVLPQSSAWKQRLGHGLLLLGALTLGANLALVGQLFHQSGSAYGLCLIWGIGVWLMAYSLRLVSLGVLSSLLLGIGYWLGLYDMSRFGILPPWIGLMQAMPLLAGGLFIPLAYRCQSRVIFGLGAIAVVSSLEVVLFDLSFALPQFLGVVLALMLTLIPALLWGYDERLWRSRSAASLGQPSFQAIAQNLAILSLAIAYYGFSFHWSWPEFSESRALWGSANLAQWPVLLGLSLAIALLLTIVEWVDLGWPRRSGRLWRLDQTSSVILVFLLVTALLPVWHWQIQPISVFATLMMNFLLFLLAMGLMREGLGEGQRRIFWSGLVLLVLQIVSRTLEYNTSLLFKALVLGLCGVGIILVGLWFERYVHRFDSSVPSSLMQSPTMEEES